MPRNYRKKTGWVPQDQRRFAIRAERKAPIDMGKLVEACLMHVLTADLPEAEERSQVRFTRDDLPRAFQFRSGAA